MTDLPDKLSLSLSPYLWSLNENLDRSFLELKCAPINRFVRQFHGHGNRFVDKILAGCPPNCAFCRLNLDRWPIRCDRWISLEIKTWFVSLHLKQTSAGRNKLSLFLYPSSQRICTYRPSPTAVSQSVSTWYPCAVKADRSDCRLAKKQSVTSLNNDDDRLHRGEIAKTTTTWITAAAISKGGQKDR